MNSSVAGMIVAMLPGLVGLVAGAATTDSATPETSPRSPKSGIQAFLSARPILPDRYDSAWEVRVNEEVRTELYAPDGQKLGEFASSAFSVVSPRLWSEGDPALYRVVFRSGEEVEERTFGFRIWERKCGRLQLNGKPVRIKALNSLAVAEAGADAEAAERLFTLLNQERANAVIGEVAEMSANFLAACDRAGIYVIDLHHGEAGRGHACVVPDEGLAATDLEINGTREENADFAAVPERYYSELRLVKRNAFIGTEQMRCEWRVLRNGEEQEHGKISLAELNTNQTMRVEMPAEIVAVWGGGGEVRAEFGFHRGGFLGWGGELIAASAIDFPVSHFFQGINANERIGYFEALPQTVD